MTDTNTQLAARAAAVDPSQRAAAEHRRLRACTPEVVALLAYCGDETARERVPRASASSVRLPLTCSPICGWTCMDGLTPEEWARGLAPLLKAALDEPAVRRVWEAIWREWWPVGAEEPKWDRDCFDLAHSLATDARQLGPRIRDVALAAVRREVFGDA